MGAVETLYGFCTFLGTAIFALIFLNYCLEASKEPETQTPEPSKPERISKADRKGRKDRKGA
jgi:hypothetical protein